MHPTSSGIVQSARACTALPFGRINVEVCPQHAYVPHFAECTSAHAHPQSLQVGSSSGELRAPYKQAVYCVSLESMFN